MKITGAYAKHFLSFKELEWTPKEGISRIDGWNYDDQSPSGAGKTALIDLISFVLFGDSPRDIKVNEFVNDQFKKGCVGGLHILLDNGQTMLVERKRKPEDLYFQIGTADPIRDVNILKTQALLEDFIQLDFNTFVNSIYFARNSNMNFISASDSEKRDILTRILDLSDFDKAYHIAKDKAKEIEALCDKKQIDSDYLIRKISDIGIDLGIAKTASHVFEDDKQEDIDRKLVEQIEHEEAIENKQETIKLLRNKTFESIKFDLRVPDLIAFDEKLEEYDQEIIELSKKRVMKPDMTKINAKLDLEENLVKKFNHLNSKCYNASYKVSEFTTIIMRLKTQGIGTCSECLQFVTKEHLSNEIIKMEKKLVDAQKDEDISTPQLRAIEKVINGLSDLKQQKAELLNQYTLETRELKTDLDKINYEKKMTDMQRNDAIQQWQNKKTEIAEKNKHLHVEQQRNNEMIAMTQDQIIAYQKQIEISNEDIKIIQSRKNGYGEIIATKTKDLDEVIKKKETLDKTLAACAKQLEYLEILKKSYKNVKYYIFESTIDELNRRINKYLEPLFLEDVKIEYTYISGKSNDKLKFSTKIIKNGIEKSYKSLSDGEKTRARLSTNFALSDIVAMRKANSLRMMILDEVFDGLPEECRERVVELLEVLKTEKDTILVIDHFQAMHNLIENTILVEKRNGISRIAA